MISIRGMVFSWVALTALISAQSVRAGTLTVTSIYPARHTITAPISTPISVTFNQPVNPASVNSNRFWAFGRWSGPVGGTFSYSNSNQTVTITPSRPFVSGDLVSVFLADTLTAADGSPFRPQGYMWQFYTRSRPGPMNFINIANISNRTNNQQTRIYGAAAADLNNDGKLDLTTVNEVSSDIRVFMNTGNPTTPFTTFLAPHPISFEASPNDPSDFNRDGKADIAAASTATSRVWVLAGNGNGTFVLPGQQVITPDAPHGIAILDLEGDGDTDIATSNTGGDNVSLFVNNGSGVFSAGPTFDSGGSSEYALGGADMNNDGIEDLVVGAIGSQEVIVHLSNGNGTFTAMPEQNAGGSVWMISCGDVNGDGNMDVSTANSGSNTGSILLGNGAGGLGAPTVAPMAQHVVATDLADLDGDGDLDWVLSAYGGGLWRIFLNNGGGSFTLFDTIDAPSNPSCAILLDFDNDRDIDLVLSDEIADVLVVERNGGIAPLGDFNNDAQVGSADFTSFSNCYGGEGSIVSQSCVHGDFDGDGDVGCSDWTAFEAAWTAPGQPPVFAACGDPVPTVSEWGVAILSLCTLIAGSVVLRKQHLLGGTPWSF